MHGVLDISINNGSRKTLLIRELLAYVWSSRIHYRLWRHVLVINREVELLWRKIHPRKSKLDRAGTLSSRPIMPVRQGVRSPYLTSASSPKKNNVVASSTFSSSPSLLIDNARNPYIRVRLRCGVVVMCRPEVFWWCPKVLPMIYSDVCEILALLPPSLAPLIQRTKIWVNHEYSYGPRQNPIHVKHTTAHHHQEWLLWYEHTQESQRKSLRCNKMITITTWYHAEMPSLLLVTTVFFLGTGHEIIQKKPWVLRFIMLQTFVEWDNIGMDVVCCCTNFVTLYTRWSWAYRINVSLIYITMLVGADATNVPFDEIGLVKR